ncbi:MAG: putative phage repressor [Caulobacter sp.]|nr:putative phage repressor [Caulobacter sp.]
MSIGERILEARKSRGWSQQRLAAELAQAQTTISSWERGRTEPSREDAARIATALDVPLADLELGQEGGAAPSRGHPRPRRAPVVGYVGAGAVAHLYSAGQGPFDEVDAPENATDDTVAVEIRGDSLGSLFNEWLVFYDEVRSPVTPDLVGRLCVVGLPDGRVLIKKLTHARTEGFYNLFSQTEDPILDVEIDWAAKVTGMTPR